MSETWISEDESREAGSEEMILNDQLDQALDHLRALLQVEWHRTEVNVGIHCAIINICPFCHWLFPRHAPDCSRQAAHEHLKGLGN